MHHYETKTDAELCEIRVRLAKEIETAIASPESASPQVQYMIDEKRSARIVAGNIIERRRRRAESIQRYQDGARYWLEDLRFFTTADFDAAVGKWFLRRYLKRDDRAPSERRGWQSEGGDFMNWNKSTEDERRAALMACRRNKKIASAGELPVVDRVRFRVHLTASDHFVVTDRTKPAPSIVQTFARESDALALAAKLNLSK